MKKKVVDGINMGVKPWTVKALLFVVGIDLVLTMLFIVSSALALALGELSEVERTAIVATTGGLSLRWCFVFSAFYWFWSEKRVGIAKRIIFLFGVLGVLTSLFSPLIIIPILWLVFRFHPQTKRWIEEKEGTHKKLGK